jgi:hypothetical protein
VEFLLRGECTRQEAFGTSVRFGRVFAYPDGTRSCSHSNGSQVGAIHHLEEQ